MLEPINLKAWALFEEMKLSDSELKSIYQWSNICGYSYPTTKKALYWLADIGVVHFVEENNKILFGVLC